MTTASGTATATASRTTRATASSTMDNWTTTASGTATATASRTTKMTVMKSAFSTMGKRTAAPSGTAKAGALRTTKAMNGRATKSRATEIASSTEANWTTIVSGTARCIEDNEGDEWESDEESSDGDRLLHGGELDDYCERDREGNCIEDDDGFLL